MVSTQLPACGQDILSLAFSNDGSELMLNKHFLKGENALPGRGREGRALVGIQRDEVDFCPEPLHEFDELAGIFPTVIDSINENIFKGDHTSVGKGKDSACFQEFFEGVTPINRHQTIPCLIVGCVQGDGQVHGDVSAELKHFRNKTARGNGDFPMGKVHFCFMHQDTESLQNMMVIGERFSHSHEDNVGQSFR